MSAREPPPVPSWKVWLRVVNTLALGSLSLGLMFGQGFHREFCWGLALVYLLWFPWRPVRAIAALALIPAWSLAGWIALIIMAGGHGGGGDPSVGIPLLAIVLTVIASLAALLLAELRSPGEPSPGLRGLALHAAALGLIGWTFLRAEDRKADIAAVEEQRESQQASLKAARGAGPDDQFEIDNLASQKHVRLMTPRQWRSQEADTKMWVRKTADRLPPQKRHAFELEWEEIFRQKEIEQRPWHRLFRTSRP